MFILIAYSLGKIVNIYGPFTEAKDAHDWSKVVTHPETVVHRLVEPKYNAD